MQDNLKDKNTNSPVLSSKSYNSQNLQISQNSENEETIDNDKQAEGVEE